MPEYMGPLFPFADLDARSLYRISCYPGDGLFPQSVIGIVMFHEDVVDIGGGTAVFQVIDQGLPDVVGEGECYRHLGLLLDKGNTGFGPVYVPELQVADIGGPQSQPDRQEKYRIVALPGTGGAVRRGQDGLDLLFAIYRWKAGLFPILVAGYGNGQVGGRQVPVMQIPEKGTRDGQGEVFCPRRSGQEDGYVMEQDKGRYTRYFVDPVPVQIFVQQIEVIPITAQRLFMEPHGSFIGYELGHPRSYFPVEDRLLPSDELHPCGHFPRFRELDKAKGLPDACLVIVAQAVGIFGTVFLLYEFRYPGG